MSVSKTARPEPQTYRSEDYPYTPFERLMVDVAKLLGVNLAGRSPSVLTSFAGQVAQIDKTGRTFIFQAIKKLAPGELKSKKLNRLVNLIRHTAEHNPNAIKTMTFLARQPTLEDIRIRHNCNDADGNASFTETRHYSNDNYESFPSEMRWVLAQVGLTSFVRPHLVRLKSDATRLSEYVESQASKGYHPRSR